MQEAGEQKLLCFEIRKHFPNFSFVGFYDKKDGDEQNIHIGEYATDNIFPCATINIGKGQCGQAVAEKRTLIAKDVRLIENYIACDSETLSEIVVPCW